MTAFSIDSQQSSSEYWGRTLKQGTPYSKIAPKSQFIISIPYDWMPDDLHN
jgi:hypothetical protein